MPFSAGPKSGIPNATHASPGSSPSSGVEPPLTRAPSPEGKAPSGTSAVASTASRSPSAMNAPAREPILSKANDPLGLLELLGGLGVLAHRGVEERLDVDVEAAEPVVLEPVHRLLEALVGLQPVALDRVDGLLELRLRAEHREALDQAGGAVGRRLVVDVLVAPLLERLVAGLYGAVDRGLRLVLVLDRRDERAAEVLLGVARDGAPERDLLAEPGRDVLLVVDLRVLGLGERLRHQLVDLGLRVLRAQHLAGRSQRVVAQVALRAHGRLEVEGGACRDGARRIVTP